MNSYDWKYIFKKVLIFFIIFVVLSFFRSCNVKALSIENKGTSIRFMPNNTYANNLNWSQNYYNGTPNDNYNGFNVFAQIIDNNNLDVIFDGRYLVSFIVFSSVNQNEISCSNLSSNFKNVNVTTGKWVENEIKSNCIDTYNTSYYNKPAIRILYEFTYRSLTGPSGITELNFIVNTNNNFFLGGDFGLDYGIAVSDIELYDINIINTWNNDKANQTIINQNNLLYGSLQQQINQNQQNTQNIINNQQQNTQDIINNQNTNTQQEIESQQVCKIIDLSYTQYENKILQNNGVISNNNFYNVTKYIDITSANIEKLDVYNGSAYLCFYDENKTFISCSVNSSVPKGNVNIPDGSVYVRFSIDNKNNKPKYKICKNGNQATNESLNDLNDSINDDNVSGAESQVNDLLDNSSFQDNSGIQSIITAPLNFIQGLTNSCSPIELTIPFIDTNVSIPCIKQELTTRLPTVVPILSTIINGFVIYRILLDIVAIVKSAREPDEDRIEVLDL